MDKSFAIVNMDESTAMPSIEGQLALLTEASATLLASPGSPTVLRTILDLSKRFIQADAYSVWRKNADTNAWEIAAMHGLSDSYGRTVPTDRGAEEAMPDHPVAIEDLDQVPFAFRLEAYRKEGIKSLITVPLRIHGEFAGTIVLYYRSPHRFPDIERRVAGVLGNLAGAALGTAELYDREKALRERAQAEERRAKFLAEAGQALSSSLDYEATLAKMVDLAVPSFADWASVDIVAVSGEIKRVAIKNVNPGKADLVEEYSRRFPPLETDPARIALRTGQAVLAEDLPDELLAQHTRNPEHAEMIRKLGIRSVILAPLVANDRSFGILTFLTGESGRRYTASDFALALELARRAATAVENARLYTESQKAQEALARSNAELRRANEDLNQFAYSASHDLQEPLRMLLLYSELLERKCGPDLDPETKEYLGFIADGANRMDMLLSDLLAYIRVVNAAPSVSELVDASAVLEKALANLGTAISDAGVCVAAMPLPHLLVEEVHLLQLFQNLIGNAIKYRSQRPPRIEISSEREGACWKISVRDNGIGIPREYVEQVFGIFKRLHDRGKYPGTGIGLAICQKIVDRYGCRIWVESEEGKGSTFCFTLPGCGWK